VIGAARYERPEDRITDLEAVNRAWEQVRDQLAATFPKVGPFGGP
jgi:hypothetical protein